MTARSKRTALRTALVPCAALLALALTAPAWAGGERCEKGDHAKATKAAHQGKATKAEKIEAMKRAGWSGMETEKDASGAYEVVRVEPGTPAAEAGVQVGDRLVAFQGIALTAENKKALHGAKKAKRVGARVRYTVARGDVQRDVTVTLVEVPEAVIARWFDDSEADQVATAGGG